MKKGIKTVKKMISIPVDLIDEIKESAWEGRKNFSQYLVDLHKEVKEMARDKKPIILKPEPVEYKPKYSDEYRKKNPMENCEICHKALRFNCGH